MRKKVRKTDSEHFARLFETHALRGNTRIDSHRLCNLPRARIQPIRQMINRTCRSLFERENISSLLHLRHEPTRHDLHRPRYNVLPPFFSPPQSAREQRWNRCAHKHKMATESRNFESRDLPPLSFRGRVSPEPRSRKSRQSGSNSSKTKSPLSPRNAGPFVTTIGFPLSSSAVSIASRASRSVATIPSKSSKLLPNAV